MYYLGRGDALTGSGATAALEDQWRVRDAVPDPEWDDPFAQWRQELEECQDDSWVPPWLEESEAEQLQGVVTRLESVGARCGDNPAAAIDVLTELERIRSAAAAAQARVTVLFERATVEAGRAKGFTVRGARRGVGPQVALARKTSPSRGDRHLALARRLATMPQTLRALELGLISEEHALVIVRETYVLREESDRAEADRELAGTLGTCGLRRLRDEARAEVDRLDPEAAARRAERAMARRRVCVEPGDSGLGVLTIHAPLPDIAAAMESLVSHCRSVEAGERTFAEVMSDEAVGLLAGSTAFAGKKCTVNLVMTPGQLFGREGGPVRVVGYGTIPARTARSLLTDHVGSDSPVTDPSPPPEGAEWESQLRALIDTPRPTSLPLPATVWLRRLFTTPDGSSLAAMDARARLFTDQLREQLIIRDDRCRHPWSDAPIRHGDHVEPHRSGGPTSVRNGQGLSVRANHIKELPGFRTRVLSESEVTAYRGGEPQRQATAVARGAAPGTHVTEITTPTGHVYLSAAPPLTARSSRRR